MLLAPRLIDTANALRRRFARRPGHASGVLLVSSGGLGDTVLFALVLPRFASLARAGETVTVLLRKDAAKMAFLFPDDIRVEAIDFGRLKRNPVYRAQVHDRLFKAHVRLAVHTDHLRHPLLDEPLIAASAAAETVAMEPRDWPKHRRALARNRRLYDNLFDSGAEHLDKVVRWTRFANWLTGAEAPPPKVRLPAERLPPAAGPDTPEVLIQAFSAVPAKQPDVALFAAIVDALPRDARVVFLGAPGDPARNPDFEPLLARPGVRFDDSRFRALLPRLRAARLVVSVDTALMHLAVAAGAPTLCLASAAYVGEIVPYAPEITPDNVTFLHAPMDCQGCLGACVKPLAEGRYACVAALDRTRILDLVRAA